MLIMICMSVIGTSFLSVMLTMKETGTPAVRGVLLLKVLGVDLLLILPTWAAYMHTFAVDR